VNRSQHAPAKVEAQDRSRVAPASASIGLDPARFPRVLKSVLHYYSERQRLVALIANGPSSHELEGCAIAAVGVTLAAVLAGCAWGSHLWPSLLLVSVGVLAAQPFLIATWKRHRTQALVRLVDQELPEVEAQFERAFNLFQAVEDPHHLELLLPLIVETGGESFSRQSPDHPVFTVLSRLLERTTAAEAPLLNGRHFWNVRLYLDVEAARKHAGTIVALLQAIERWGDRQYVPPVRGLAHGPATSPEGIRVREEARRVLASLEVRLKAEEEASTRPRPGTAPETPLATLPRPGAPPEAPI
jgi:hypothetical protein